ncbi:hypothetical protein [Streptomyces sp. NPDC048565]|uniref:hypothetical protein n=1 Tax=Streptomyces sp. NPDC048565 TaxID=3155266 RepID=UPI003447C9E5
MTFEEYAKAWFARKRGLTGSTKAATESRMRTHAYPEIGSRKMLTFDSFVVERFGLLRVARDDDAFRLIVDLMGGMACATARPSPST